MGRAGIPLRTAEEAEAYYWARKWAQILGFVGAMLALIMAGAVAVTGGPTWAVMLFVATAAPNAVLSAGWVPRRYRPLIRPGSHT